MNNIISIAVKSKTNLTLLIYFLIVLVAQGQDPINAQNKNFTDLISGDTILQNLFIQMKGAPVYSSSGAGVLGLPANITGEALKAVISPVVSRLEDLVRTSSGEARSVLNDALHQLRGIQTDLDRSLEKNVKVPIQSLTLQTQVLAAQAFAFSSHLDLITARQRECLSQNLDVALAGIKSAVAEVSDKVPIINKGEPWLGYFKFDGFRTTNLVPSEGGRFSITGHKLWSIADEPPVVKLFTSDQSAQLATLVVSPGTDANSISVSLPVSIMSKNVGECLRLQVTSFYKGGFFNFFTEKVTRAMPMCIPQRYNRSFILTGYLSYEIQNLVQRELEEQGFPEGINSACKNVASYDQTLIWKVPENFKIISYRTVYEDHRHDDGFNIKMAINGNSTIKASGHLARPSCICILFSGCSLTSHSYWRARIAPIIEGYETLNINDSASSLKFGFTGNKAIGRVIIPKSQNSDKTVFWFELIEHTNSSLGSLNYSSRRISVTEGYSSPIETIGSHSISAHFNPTAVNGTAELEVTLQETVDCGF